jgi:hypothetical protein
MLLLAFMVSFADQLGLAHRTFIDDLVPAVIAHLFPAAGFLERAQAPDAKTRFAVEFA